MRSDRRLMKVDVQFSPTGCELRAWRIWLAIPRTWWIRGGNPREESSLTYSTTTSSSVLERRRDLGRVSTLDVLPRYRARTVVWETLKFLATALILSFESLLRACMTMRMRASRRWASGIVLKWDVTIYSAVKGSKGITKNEVNRSPVCSVHP
jgi:hypothetical protein